MRSFKIEGPNANISFITRDKTIFNPKDYFNF